MTVGITRYDETDLIMVETWQRVFAARHRICACFHAETDNLEDSGTDAAKSPVIND
jgi:hypothetical protein